MTNLENLIINRKEELAKVFAVTFGISKETNELAKCYQLECCNCIFCADNCEETKIKWLLREVENGDR